MIELSLFGSMALLTGFGVVWPKSDGLKEQSDSSNNRQEMSHLLGLVWLMLGDGCVGVSNCFIKTGSR
jgi:hypothetical protein